MPSETITWTGIPSFKSALNGNMQAIWNASRASLVQLAGMVEANAKGNFSGAHRRGAPHTGGAQPNVVTGNLRRSIIHTQPISMGTGVYQTQVWPDAIYGRAVELGVPGRSRAFPYFAPAVKSMRERMTETLASNWSKYV